MSRYQIDQGEYRVAVGWDQRDASFFMAVYSLKALAERERLEQMYFDMAVSMRGHDSLIDQIAAAEADCGPICWRGATYDEIACVTRLSLIARPYAELPPEIVARLLDDRMQNPPERKPVDKFIRRLVADAARRADRP